MFYFVSNVIKPNKAFKSDSQRLAVSLRSSITKRRSHLNAALEYFIILEGKWKYLLVGQVIKVEKQPRC